jgi:hypothetical protein
VEDKGDHMSACRKLVVVTLILIGLLLVGCETSTGAGKSVANACDYDYSRLKEKNWSFYQQFPLPAGNDGELEASQCVVVYRVEPQQVPPDTGIQFTQNISPVFGMVYRKDRNRPLDIHAYPLALPGDMYLGERNVSARVADSALSGANQPQLIVENRDAGGTVVEASIWEWQEKTLSEESGYKSRGWFFGDAGVTVVTDTVTVLNRWRTVPRSQLAERRVYTPREKKSYYPKPDPNKPEDTSRVVDPVTVDLVPLVMPDDANLPTAEYPEKLPLAFYQRIPVLMTDTAKLTVLMSPDMIESYRMRDAKVYGCLANSQLSQVYVQDLSINGSQGIPAHIENENKMITDTVTIKSLCILNVGGHETQKNSLVTWSVRWERKVDSRTGNWQIVGATAR